MLQYLLAGLALGAVYAIASSALVVNFVSTGVVNFSFGSMAFVVARFYYWLNSQHHMSSISAGILAVLALAPAMGVVLYGLLFRHLRSRSTLVKVVATIGLSVALPPVVDFIFGTQTIDSAPGLASLRDKPFRLFGTAVTTDQLITYGFLVFVVAAGSVILRCTDVGLRVRAMVDSQAMTSLSGTSPGRVAIGVWAVSTALAGLAGILVAPTNGLNITGMTTLMAAALAAMVVARLRSLPGVLAASIGMGVVTDVVQKYLPANSSLTAAIIPSIPFGFILVALVVYSLRAGRTDESAGIGGPLDAAIKPAHEDADEGGGDLADQPKWSQGLALLPLVAMACLPLIFKGSAFWLGLTALGICYGITFLTFTIVTGEGGMLWLSQIIFAGGGAIGAAQLSTIAHLPVLLAIVISSMIVALAGAIIGLLTIRLGDLYVALATLSFGLLVETLVFTRSRFQQGGLGVIFNRPDFAQDDFPFAYFALAVFLLLALLTWNLRRSTTGLALRAVRDSPPAACTLGLNLIPIKVLVGALGAFVAALGGSLLAADTLVAQPSSYATFAGLVWLAVVVTMGVRSVTAALMSGLAFALLPGVMQTYLPARLGELPAVLFGLGAIAVARHPEGAVLQNGRQLRRLLLRLTSKGSAGAVAISSATVTVGPGDSNDSAETPLPVSGSRITAEP